MSDKSAKMLERVRALLAKAEATEFPEEAETFRAKADDIMTAYAIEQWQVDEAQQGVNKRPTPERRDYTMAFWYQGDNPAREALWGMFNDIARHCRVVVVWRKWSSGTCPIVGLASDLDYFDLLFTSLMLELAHKIDPQPSGKLEYIENLVMLKEAGLAWPEIARKMVESGLAERPAEGSSLANKMNRQYRVHCKQAGIERSYHNHKTYRREFAGGFVSGVREQLSRMRRAQESTTGESTALVLRDIRSVVQDAVYDIWGDLRPHERDCDCAKCKAARKPVRYRRDTRKTDYAARDAGQQAGREAKIQQAADRRMANRKGIEG